MNTRRMKRRISAQTEHSTRSSPQKKLKLKSNARPLETPHSTANSQTEAYKLPSSVGSHASPKSFSPVPKRTFGSPLKTSKSRTSSIGLKENAGRATSRRKSEKPRQENPSRSRSRGGGLYSPFTSQPNSAAPSPNLNAPIVSRKLGMQKRTLSERQLPSNPPAATQSNTSSPTCALSLSSARERDRRPSVPTMTRPTAWNLDQPQLSNGPADFLDLFGHSGAEVDFNRPPSQLSLYDYNCNATYDSTLDFDADLKSDGLFTDIQGISTPFHRKPSYGINKKTINPALLSSYDSDTDDIDLQTSIFNLGSAGYATPANASLEDLTLSQNEHMLQRSPWVSDSLVSPPQSMDWQREEGYKEHAYSHSGVSEDVDMADAAVSQAPDEVHVIHEDVLQSLLNSLMLDEEPRLPNSGLSFRSRSLDSSLDPIAPRPLLSETMKRSSMIKTSEIPVVSLSVPTLAPALPVISGTRRSRSGTITSSTASKLEPPLFSSSRRTRSGTIVQAPTLPVLDEGAHPAAAKAKRTRSGTIVQPAMPTGNSKRQSMAMPMTDEGSSANGAANTAPPEVPDDWDELDLLGPFSGGIDGHDETAKNTGKRRSVVKRVMTMSRAIGKWKARSASSMEVDDAPGSDELNLRPGGTSF